jgi:hypothetical protein
MKKTYLLFTRGSFFFLGVCCLLSCSFDEDTIEDSSPAYDLVVFGRTNQGVFQANLTDDNEPEYHNLTNDQGVALNSFLMNVNNGDELFGYYYYPNGFQGGYTVWEKNISNNAASTYIDFCNETDIETAYFPQVHNDYITVFTAELISTGNRVLNLRIYNKVLDICTKTSIGVADQFQQLTRLIVGDKILTYHFNNSGQTVLTKIALDTGAIEGQLTFDNSGAATVQNDKIYFYPSSTEVNQFTYDLATLQLLDTSLVGVNPFLGTGLFKTQIKGNSILIDRYYVQPAQFSTFPALLDLDTGEINMIADLGTINNNLTAHLDSDLALETSQFYTIGLDEEIIVGSYTLFDFNLTTIEYGIYYSEFSGNILNSIPIDFMADDLIIR